MLTPAEPHELADVADLVNSAYRGDSSRAGWTTEADLLGGQRTDAGTLAADLAAAPDARLLVWRDGAAIIGAVWLASAGTRWYLGMLTVRPDLQAAGLGRTILAAAEDIARREGGAVMAMHVLAMRGELIAWYERRGYAASGATAPFPYGDAAKGAPRRDDLHFIVREKALRPLTLLRWRPELARDFHDINAEWIETMFTLEPTDREVLENPEARIVAPGGDILFAATADGAIVGACALQKSGAGQFELTKMGVRASARGLGAGAFLLDAAVARAGELGAERLYLLTNARCAAAVHLYEKHGFVHDAGIMAEFGARYARCDVAMLHRGSAAAPPSPDQ